MNDGQKVKAAKAKLYNLKSGIDGLISLVDSGVIQPEMVGSALTSLTTKTIDELDKHFAGNDDLPV